MKVLLLFVSLIGFNMHTIYSQNGYSFNDFSKEVKPKTYTDSHDQILYILRTNGKTIKLSYKYMIKIEESDEWRDLMSSFQEDFAKVINSLPEYANFEILYFKNEKLLVNEIKDKVTYSFSDLENVNLVTSNYCTMKGNGVIILIEIDQYQELLDPNLISEINEGVSKVKSKRTFDFTKEKLYDATSKKLTKAPNRAMGFEYNFGANVGFLDSNPSMTGYFTAGFSTRGLTYLYTRAEFTVSYRFEDIDYLIPGLGIGSRFQSFHKSVGDFQYGFEAIYTPGGYFDSPDPIINWVLFFGRNNRQNFRCSIPVSPGERGNSVGIGFLSTPTFTYTSRF